jgi:hypothetical protein
MADHGKTNGFKAGLSIMGHNKFNGVTSTKYGKPTASNGVHIEVSLIAIT